jgi:hypothetical protein
MASVLVAGAIAISMCPAYRARAEAGPADLPLVVIEFIGRRANCQEWSNQATDPKRAAQADSMTRSLQCGDIADSERVLREQYAGNPGVLAGLDASWRKVVKRVPVETAPKPLPSDSNR